MEGGRGEKEESGREGSVSIVRRFDSPKIQLKLKLALTLTLTLTDTGDLRTIEPSDYRADTGGRWEGKEYPSHMCRRCFKLFTACRLI